MNLKPDDKTWGFFRLGPVLVMAFSILGVPAHAARVVNTVEDRERLLGWDAHQRQQKRLEQERLEDVDSVDKARRRFEKEQAEGLVDYRKWKARQKASLDESSPEYKKDLQLKVDAYLAQDRRRENFIEERQKQRRLAQSEVSLTEETELGLDEKRPRADWEARNLLADKSKGPGASISRPVAPSYSPGSNSNSGRSDYIPPEFDSPPPPPPMSPPSDFFEPEVTPPGGDDFEPPPPPPIDEGAPPPVFEDDF